MGTEKGILAYSPATRNEFDMNNFHYGKLTSTSIINNRDIQIFHPNRKLMNVSTMLIPKCNIKNVLSVNLSNVNYKCVNA